MTAGSHTITLRQPWCTALEVTADSALYKAQTSVLWESLVCVLHHSPSAVWEDTSAMGRVACRTVTWWLVEDGVPLGRNQDSPHYILLSSSDVLFVFVLKQGLSVWLS